MRGDRGAFCSRRSRTCASVRSSFFGCDCLHLPTSETKRYASSSLGYAHGLAARPAPVASRSVLDEGPASVVGSGILRAHDDSPGGPVRIVRHPSRYWRRPPSLPARGRQEGRRSHRRVAARPGRHRKEFPAIPKDLCEARRPPASAHRNLETRYRKPLRRHRRPASRPSQTRASTAAELRIPGQAPA